jgi:hypothetical protein
VRTAKERGPRCPSDKGRIVVQAVETAPKYQAQSPPVHPETGGVQFEVALEGLDQLERVRHGDGGPDEDIGELMHAFSEILLAPPGVEILRVDETPAPAS